MTASNSDHLPRQPLPMALFTKWLATGLFCTISLLPIFQAALISTRTDTASGRFGLILPVLLLADESARSLLIQMFFAASLNLIFVTLVGLTLGLTAANTRNRLVKGVFQLAFWPATFPVWLGPVVVLAVAKTAIFALNENQKLLFWLFWVGWWGSMRLAAEIRDRVQQIDPRRLEACELLGGGPQQAFRMVIRPVIQNELRQTLLLSTAILIFDPSPILLAGVGRWPASMVVSELCQPAGPGLYLAASWLLVMGLVMAFFSVIIRWLAGQKSVEISEIHFDKKTNRQKGYSLVSRATPLALFSIWPWLLLVALFQMQLSEIQSIISTWNLSEFQLHFQFILSISALLAICIFASFLFHNRSINQGLAESGKSLIVFQPLLVTALSLQLAWAWTIAWKLPLDPAGNALFWQTIALVCIVLMAVGTVACRQKLSGVGLLNQELQKAKFEAAIIMGASPARARKMAGIVGGSAQSSVTQVAALFEHAWWLATAPAWVLVAPIAISGYYPVVFLTGFATNQDQAELIQNSIYLIIPALSARLISKLY